MGDILATQKNVNEAVTPISDRLAAVEANPVLTVVGCDGQPLVVGAKTPTCAEVDKLADTIVVENPRTAVVSWQTTPVSALATPLSLIVDGNMPANTSELPGYDNSQEAVSPSVFQTMTPFSVTTGLNAGSHTGLLPYNVQARLIVTHDLDSDWATNGGFYSPRDVIKGGLQMDVRVELYENTSGKYTLVAMWVEGGIKTPQVLTSMRAPARMAPKEHFMVNAVPSGGVVLLRAGAYMLVKYAKVMSYGPTPYRTELSTWLNISPLAGANRTKLLTPP